MGDDCLDGAAIYLAGIMTHFGIPFDHVAGTDKPGDDFCSRRYGLYVLSDYPRHRFEPSQMEHIVECVRQGSGLAMFGGWESYHGLQGEYHRSPLVDVLPVEMSDKDDRRNYAQPCLIMKTADHPILEGIPWETPPGIGGFNAFRPKVEAQTLLKSVRFSVNVSQDNYSFVPEDEAPLLVVGGYGEGRVTALATDVAPHWVGGFVDWGNDRVKEDVGEGFIDVGNWYARFFRQLLVWTGQL
ncbi:MAG: hypothetical protein JXM70_23495 [Pirellulales bacterium]|nr:hypothetical protein [Pirellulales bacterium]